MKSGCKGMNFFANVQWLEVFASFFMRRYACFLTCLCLRFILRGCICLVFAVAYAVLWWVDEKNRTALSPEIM